MSTPSLLVRHAPKSEEDLNYRRLIVSFQQLLARNGLKKQAFAEEGRSRFYGLPEHEKKVFLRQLRSYYTILQDAEFAGVDIVYDTKSMLSYTAGRLGLKIASDFTDRLGTEDIVEIYDFDNIQLYRNMRFFDVSDYTLDDFYCTPWQLLYERAHTVNEALSTTVGRAVTELRCMAFNIPLHSMRERNTVRRKLVEVDLGYVAPLVRDGVAVAWVGSSRARVLTEETNDEAEKLKFLGPRRVSLSSH